jgi:hypothetical protein
VYTAVRGLVNANKLSGTTVVNSFPEAEPSFPCSVLPMPDVDVPVPVVLSGTKREYRVMVEFVCYATATGTGQGQAKVAAMLDNLQSTFESTGTANLLFVSMSPSSIERLEVNEQKLYAAGGMATFAFYE